MGKGGKKKFKAQKRGKKRREGIGYHRYTTLKRLGKKVERKIGKNHKKMKKERLQRKKVCLGRSVLRMRGRGMSVRWECWKGGGRETQFFLSWKPKKVGQGGGKDARIGGLKGRISRMPRGRRFSETKGSPAGVDGEGTD